MVAIAALIALYCTLAFADTASARPRCGGKLATIVGNNGDNVIKAPKQGPQVIYAGGGDDRIIAKRGQDIVCGGPGNDIISGGTGTDVLYGGAGNDFVDGGPGRDKAYLDAGNDTFVGGGGGDVVRGADGDDRMSGGIQDDSLYGDAGSDLLIGGHGIDVLRGGSGNDWARGDTNRDRYFGDGGNDTVSFATATPPGPHPTVDGVRVNLADHTAFGDDSAEQVYGFENVVGSIFHDEIYGSGSGTVDGGYGDDECGGFIGLLCQQLSLLRTSSVMVRGLGTPDPGVVLFGDGSADSWSITGAGSQVRISGSNLQAGSGCEKVSGGAVCSIPPGQLGYVLAWGGNGNDQITLNGGIPGSAVLKVDGGPGNDVLTGSNGPDLLYAGETGSDTLVGRGGDDALVGRPGGADRLYGGGGNDNLVSDDPCAGHIYRGGPGKADVAGFGHDDIRGVVARIGGRARLSGSNCAGTDVGADNEVLEGTRFPDVLYASTRRDLLIGREGKDRCVGGRHTTC